MNQRNTYQYTANGPSSTGTEWPRVSARVGLEGRRAAVPSRGAASRDARRVPRQPPANAYSMPLPPQGPPEPADEGGNWSNLGAGSEPLVDNFGDVRRTIQDRSNSIDAIAEARRDTNQRMQSQFQRWSGENDFTPYNSAVPPQPVNAPGGPQSTRLVRPPGPEADDADEHPAKNYDPNVPSYAQPGFDPLQPSASADVGVILDQIRGKPERGEIALRRAPDAVATELQAYPQVFPDAPFMQIPQSNLIINPVPVYISLDSRDRDRRTYPQTNRYRIPFVSSSDSTSVRVTGDRLRNIYSISVLSSSSLCRRASSASLRSVMSCWMAMK